MTEPRVGILGGGQLARMLAIAARGRGMSTRFLDPAADACAREVSEQLLGAYDDRAALDRLSDGVDVVTYEFENAPVASAEYLVARGVRVAPPPEALAKSQDRWLERELFRSLGIPTPRCRRAATLDELTAAVDAIGTPVVAKWLGLGYDGKGQAKIGDASEAARAWSELDERPVLVDEWVGFRRELSIVAVRSARGEVAFYPLSENRHHHGILRTSRAPFPAVAPAIADLARDYAKRILERLQYVGVIALELFEIDGEHGPALLANEIAPRVHNTGHWTIDGARTSQFENHLLAILGRELGPIDPISPEWAMVNAVGADLDRDAIAKVEGAVLHWYGKSPRPGRKVGHVNVLARDRPALERAIAALEPITPFVV
jgi:5-(carboxyamino)imidazole ribonucleotide synthase